MWVTLYFQNNSLPIKLLPAIIFAQQVVLSFQFCQFCLFSFKQNDFASGLELDLEKYVVPTTPNLGSGVVYAANLTENPRFLSDTGTSSNNNTTQGIPQNLIKDDAPPNGFGNTEKVWLSFLCSIEIFLRFVQLIIGS